MKPAEISLAISYDEKKITKQEILEVFNEFCGNDLNSLQGQVPSIQIGLVVIREIQAMVLNLRSPTNEPQCCFKGCNRPVEGFTEFGPMCANHYEQYWDDRL